MHDKANTPTGHPPQDWTTHHNTPERLHIYGAGGGGPEAFKRVERSQSEDWAAPYEWACERCNEPNYPFCDAYEPDSEPMTMAQLAIWRNRALGHDEHRKTLMAIARQVITEHRAPNGICCYCHTKSEPHYGREHADGCLLVKAQEALEGVEGEEAA